VLVIGALLFGIVSSRCQPQLATSLQDTGSKVNLSWPATLETLHQGTVFPEFTVERSTDLVHWTPIGGKVRGLEDRSGPRLNLSLDKAGGTSFYRVVADPNSPATDETGSGGEEVFGYGNRFASELNQLGFMSVDAFATQWPQPSYLPHLSWDPTTAQFWTNFNTDPTVWNATLPPNSPLRRIYDFRLNTNEQAVFLTNGFVVSERLGTYSFADSYYRIFNDDLPVFVTADSILQAWHRTYLNMLEELEELQLATLLERVTSNMASQLPLTWQQFGQGPLRNSILDADYFLTVARSLRAGTQVPNSLAVAGQSANVTATLTAISNLTFQVDFPIFGSIRGVDFSQFKIRGHYTNSDRLRRYFQTMMWCGRTDFRIASVPPNQTNDLRQLGAAVVLNHLLRQSGQYTNWSAIEQITRVFVGMTDSMTFAQLDQLLAAANIASPADVPDLLTLTNLQTRLLTGELGAQSITGDAFFSPLSPEEMKLPRSFTVCGQKFILDSWVFSQVVFDKIHWTPDDTPLGCGTDVMFTKVIRRKPSCLDVAFAVFGNDQVVPDIVERITRTNGVVFRDGLPYQHNLTAARNVIDSQNAGIWTNNIYTAWLAALRSLSVPTTDPEYPEAMRTRAWAMKTLNTQLASWTELRHDTVLYAKQSYTPQFMCGYPDGFVEPRPDFWRRMEVLANLTAAAISSLPLSGTVAVPDRSFSWMWITNNLAVVKSNQVACLTNFAAQVVTLRGIAEKELAQQSLTPAETDFLKNVIELWRDYTGARGFNGWYPQLFYRNVFAANAALFHQEAGSDKWDLQATDVHTDVPDDVVCDPGAVIHEGIGNVHLLMIAVDNGPDQMVYAGPVFSHYEFEVPGVNRLSDEDWKARLQAGQKPPSPEWTRGYLIPSP